jgi:UDP-2-acetamido-3-amino-2,3-dideoxy-glucuronate N-acetyltransferase
VLLVGHLFAYHPAVAWMREALADGIIGEPWHIIARRLNLGIVRRDENAFWSLAPHDISIIVQLFGTTPSEITARGAAYLRPDVEDLVYADLAFADGRTAHIHVSWLDPGKVRQTVVLGSLGMLVFDDGEPWERKVAIHPYLVQLGDATQTRKGAVVYAPLAPAEPLVRECAHFVECIRSGARPLTDGWDGVRVIRVLTAGTHALRTGGVTPLEEPHRSHDRSTQ